MKKLILLVTLLISIAGYGQQRDERLLKDKFKLVPENGRIIIPFYMNEKVLKVGFARNSSSPSILIEPCYDDIDYGSYALVPVKKNGKWGIVDTMLREPSYKQPIIPCIYDYITVVDDNTIKATVNGKTKTITYDKQRN